MESDVTDEMLGRRDVVVVEGAGAHAYLQSQVSQDLEGMAQGDQRWTFVLEPSGKIDSLARITRVSDERFELDTDQGFGAELLARIKRFKIRVEAEASLGEERGVDADEAARIERGWPRLGREIMPGETIPGGTGLAAIAICFTKGCYPGQELVERMESRAAQAPKTLRRLTVPAGASVGDPIVDDGVEVGVITSVSGTNALGWVKRSSELGTVVQF